MIRFAKNTSIMQKFIDTTSSILINRKMLFWTGTASIQSRYPFDMEFKCPHRWRIGETAESGARARTRTRSSASRKGKAKREEPAENTYYNSPEILSLLDCVNFVNKYWFVPTLRVVNILFTSLVETLVAAHRHKQDFWTVSLFFLPT